MKSLLVGVALILAGSLPSFADQAAFLPDGKRVVCAADGLQIKSLEDNSETKLAYPGGTPLDPWAPLARTADGLLAVAGQSEIMTWNPASTEWKLLWKAPEGVTIEDLTCDSKSGNIILVTAKGEEGPSWMVLAKHAKEPARVFNRRAKPASDPSFDAAGNLYFTCLGDVWKGGIETGDSEEVPYVLCGERMWPLARQETSPSNSSGLAARSVVAFGPRLLVDLSRSGGSGWGNIVRVPNVDPYKEGLPLKWEKLESVEGGAAMAVAPDGKTVAIYLSAAKRWFLVEEPDGPMVPLPSAK